MLVSGKSVESGINTAKSRQALTQNMQHRPLVSCREMDNSVLTNLLANCRLAGWVKVFISKLLKAINTVFPPAKTNIMFCFASTGYLFAQEDTLFVYCLLGAQLSLVVAGNHPQCFQQETMLFRDNCSSHAIIMLLMKLGGDTP